MCISNSPLVIWVISLIEAEWHIYVSVNSAIVGSDNGLLPVQHQAITRTNFVTEIYRVTGGFPPDKIQ